MSRRSVYLQLPRLGAYLPSRIRVSGLLALLIALVFSFPASAQTTPPYALRVLSSNFMGISGVTLDAHGNAYVVDADKQLVEEFIAVNGVIPSNPTVRSLGSGYTSPRSIALDAAGDLFVANYGSIVELMAVNGSIPDNPTISTVLTLQGTDQFGKITMDGLGNLEAFVSGDSGEAIIQLEAVNGTLPASPVIRTLFSVAGSDLGGLASDSKGNVYYLFFNFSNTSIYELTAVNGMIPDGAVGQPVLLEPDPPIFEDFAVDSAGNMFIAEVVSAETCSLVKVSAVNGVIPANPTQTTLYSAPQATFRSNAIALDANDNMFIADFFTTGPGEGVTTDELAEVSPASVTLTPATYNYGSVDLSSSAASTFTLTNASLTAVSIASTSLPSSVFTIASSTCTTSLAAGASCTYKIEFAPTAAGAQTVTFGVTDDAGTQTASLTGTGVTPAAPPAPAAALTPASADFGSVNVGSSSGAKTFTLTNAGTAALPITSVTVTGANAASFALGTNGCGSTLAAGASCAISISLKPTAAGSDAASLTVIDSVGTQTSTLTGTGVAVVTPDFTIAATPATQTVAVGGTANYTVNVTPTGGFDSAVTLAATGFPPGATVTFTPASVTPGSGAVSSTMAIHVASLTTVSENTPGRNSTWRFAAPALAMVFFFIPFRHLRKWRGMLCLLLCSPALLVSGCGGGFGFGTPPKTATTYTVMVTGTSGSLTHSTTVQITVQAAAQTEQE